MPNIPKPRQPVLTPSGQKSKFEFKNPSVKKLEEDLKKLEDELDRGSKKIQITPVVFQDSYAQMKVRIEQEIKEINENYERS